jgi:hypothetical protein
LTKQTQQTNNNTGQQLYAPNNKNPSTGTSRNNNRRRPPPSPESSHNEDDYDSNDDDRQRKSSLVANNTNDTSFETGADLDWDKPNSEEDEPLNDDNGLQNKYSDGGNDSDVSIGGDDEDDGFVISAPPNRGPTLAGRRGKNNSQSLSAWGDEVGNCSNCAQSDVVKSKLNKLTGFFKQQRALLENSLGALDAYEEMRFYTLIARSRKTHTGWLELLGSGKVSGLESMERMPGHRINIFYQKDSTVSESLGGDEGTKGIRNFNPIGSAPFTNSARRIDTLMCIFRAKSMKMNKALGLRGDLEFLCRRDLREMHHHFSGHPLLYTQTVRQVESLAARVSSNRILLPPLFNIVYLNLDKLLRSDLPAGVKAKIRAMRRSIDNDPDILKNANPWDWDAITDEDEEDEDEEDEEEIGGDEGSDQTKLMGYINSDNNISGHSASTTPKKKKH